MGADFYTDDYGGDYYDVYGGGGDYSGYSGYDLGGEYFSDPYLDIGAGGDFNYGYGFDAPGIISPGGDAIAWGGTDFNYGYGFDQGLPPDYAPGFEPGGSDLFGAFFDYYSGQGYDDYTAMQLAAEQSAAGSILTETYEAAPPPILPDIGEYFPLPYVSPYDYWQSPPYIPNFPEGPAPPPPSSPRNLPPYCPAGQYHPYPIGHPQQNLCVAFPQATTQAPKPPSATSGAPPPAPKPQAKPPSQQQCPQGYYKATNSQCLPISRCTTPGTVFDAARGICVPKGQAVSPLPIPSEAKDLLANLKELPWWVWLAAGGLLLLSQGESKTTTVRYRRGS